MITKEKWEAFRSTGKIQSEIEEHMTKVLQEAFKIYGGELYTWYYPGAAEGEMGEMHVWSDSIPITVEPKKDISCNMWIEDEEYRGYLAGEFPIHFLFLSVEEVKKRISKFKKEFDKREKLRKQRIAKKRKESKAKKEKLVKAAVKKLTKEERKALGL